MIIVVDASGNLSLDEPDNFRGFKVLSALSDKKQLAKALGVADALMANMHCWHFSSVD